MKLEFDANARSILDTICQAKTDDQALFLVGGAVRDLLLGRPLHDLDFVMDGNPTALARRLANRMNAGFFMLDDERHTARVMHHRPDGRLFPLDFVAFNGADLNADLRSRDFTINAMALSLSDFQTLIDPFGGQEDLRAGLMRACGDHVLNTDPVRVLRGIRQALQFGFLIEDHTADLMCDAASFLPRTSYERQRDELFKILEGPDPALGVRFLQQFGVLETLIPELTRQLAIPASPPHVYPLWEHTIKVVSNLKMLLDCLMEMPVCPSPQIWWVKDAVEKLGGFRSAITAFFTEHLTPERSKLGLILLSALLHDIGKPATMQMGEDSRLHYYNHDSIGADLAWDTARKLQLSNAEAEWVQTAVRYHMRLLPMVNGYQEPTTKAIYRYFRRTGEVGVAIALLSLADNAATYGPKLDQTKWCNVLEISRLILAAWWEKKEQIVVPSLLLNGHDLQSLFNLKPGKMIGQLLSNLAEAQVSGEVKDRPSAEKFIAESLIEIDQRDYDENENQ